MAMEGRRKAILAGKLEVYDVIADPGETHDLAASGDLSRPARAALQSYPRPSANVALEESNSMSGEERRKLASLGYVSSSVKPVVRPDAPRPADMARLFPILDRAAGLFVREQYAEAIPLLERILKEDALNLDAALRLASAHSALGHDAEAEEAFKRAAAIAPDSQDVRTYAALHYAHGRNWQKAVPMLERIVQESPDRLPALEALAVMRERQGRIEESVRLRQQIHRQRRPAIEEMLHLGDLAMSVGQTDAALDAFESARKAQGPSFRRDVELGVLYLASNRWREASEALDRVPPSSPGYSMALFKRAQVSVLLHEPDAPARIEAARVHADETTRELIARERLFR
jgi:tetratricopeptide (TPR) repeat protein